MKLLTKYEGAHAPKWIESLLNLLRDNSKSEDPVHFLVWPHEDHSGWHIDIFPSFHEEAGEKFIREYQVQLAPIFKVLTNISAVADLNYVGIAGVYQKHPVCVVIHMEPFDFESAMISDEPPKDPNLLN
jgi:hypothetical protein